jgi:hypothetical protein
MTTNVGVEKLRSNYNNVVNAFVSLTSDTILPNPVTELNKPENYRQIFNTLSISPDEWTISQITITNIDTQISNIFEYGFTIRFLQNNTVDPQVQQFQGPQGVQGPAGPPGPAGVQGSPGPAGPVGPQGVTGAGVQGSPGPTGPEGPQGSPGTTGPQGSPGITGPQGSPGVTGATGPQGSPGVTGATGPQGSPGVTGPAGVGGITGPDHFIAYGLSPGVTFSHFHRLYDIDKYGYLETAGSSVPTIVPSGGIKYYVYSGALRILDENGVIR